MYYEISSTLQLPPEKCDRTLPSECQCKVCRKCNEFMYVVSTNATLELPVICKGVIAREIPLRDIFYECKQSKKDLIHSDCVLQRFTIPLRLAIESANRKILEWRAFRLKVGEWWGTNLFEMICATEVCGTFALLVRALLKNNADKALQVRGTNNKWQIEYDAYTKLLAIWIGKYEKLPDEVTPLVYEHTNWSCDTKWAIRDDVIEMRNLLTADKQLFTEYHNALRDIMLRVCGDSTLFYRIRGALKKHVLVRLMVPNLSHTVDITSDNLLIILTPFVEPLVRLVLTWIRVYGSEKSQIISIVNIMQDADKCKKIAAVVSNLLLFNFGPEETRGVTNKNLDYFSVSLSETLCMLETV
jgi:hypothetical protein